MDPAQVQRLTEEFVQSALPEPVESQVEKLVASVEDAATKLFGVDTRRFVALTRERVPVGPGTSAHVVSWVARIEPRPGWTLESSSRDPVAALQNLASVLAAEAIYGLRTTAAGLAALRDRVVVNGTALLVPPFAVALTSLGLRWHEAFGEFVCYAWLQADGRVGWWIVRDGAPLEGGAVASVAAAKAAARAAIEAARAAKEQR